RHCLPLVTLKAAMTLDGKIAAPPPLVPEPPAKSLPRTDWITGESARAHVQTLRHKNDAIMTGVGTILADDPLLTDRSGLPRRRPLLRVVLDSMLRLSPESRIVRSANQDVLVLCSFAEEKKRQKLRDLGVRVEQISTVTADGRPEMAAITRRLGDLEISSVLVEGGSAINWATLVSGIADKVFFYYAPRILAGTCSTPFATGTGFPELAGAPRVKDWHLHSFGEDFALEGYLRDPYEISVT
ncbi:MAG: dihydrofolate reductase family protein, partial [Acidobacteriales bacterium]|nr:dihydrofolate reductase family protein [Terriglobales bacterium]